MLLLTLWVSRCSRPEASTSSRSSASLPLIAAQVLLIARELAFSSYISVYWFMNILGHLFRLISVYFFYKAIVVIGLTRPFDLLFCEFSVKNEEMGKLNTSTGS